jgi:hypothetical protein
MKTKKITVDLPPLRSPAAEVSISKRGDRLTISKPPEGFVLDALALTPPDYKEPNSHYYYLLFRQEGKKERYRLFIGTGEEMHEAQQLSRRRKGHSTHVKAICYRLWLNPGTVIFPDDPVRRWILAESRKHPLYKGRLNAIDLGKAKVETI